MLSALHSYKAQEDPSYKNIVPPLKLLDDSSSKKFFEELKAAGILVKDKKTLKDKKKRQEYFKLLDQKNIENGFKFLAKRYKDKSINITYDYDLAHRRVLSTKLCPANDNCYGESDESGIWICKNKINYAELVGTILHEALHYFAFFNGKEICEKDEHYVMRILGDDC